ncbi:hypothetical protein FRB99_007755 [Tulasnella sp. 403]|nr:hypothetical protein FRB99_007755 [Tulasnella sp. 403]
MVVQPQHDDEVEYDSDDDGMDTDDGSSAPNSENFFEEDDEPLDVELNALEDEDYHVPIPVILRLIPPTHPDGPPVLEVWGNRPFGYSGQTVIWTTYRAEPESDSVPDDEAYWAPLGIRVDPDEYHRAYLVRKTPATETVPPPAPAPLQIFYTDPQSQYQPGPGALAIKTFSWRPENPNGSDNFQWGRFWIVGCGKVVDRKDLKRIRMKVDVYLNVIHGRHRHR